MKTNEIHAEITAKIELCKEIWGEDHQVFIEQEGDVEEEERNLKKKNMQHT